MFVIFAFFGSVILMNLLVAIMVDKLTMSDAESLLYSYKVDEISKKISWMEMIYGTFRKTQEDPMEDIEMTAPMTSVDQIQIAKVS